MPFSVEVTSGDASSEDVRASIVDILTGSEILSLATTSGVSGPNANVAFFAFDDALNLFFVSERATRHSQNLAQDPSAAAVIHLPPPSYGEGLRGVQLRGFANEVHPADTEHPLNVYRRRFPGFAADEAVRDGFRRATGPSVLYQFVANEVTVLDEPRFGRRVYVTAGVTR